MSRDYLNIGCTPASEDCQQVGTVSYDGGLARKECEAYREQLRRQFGPEPEGARLAIKSFPHDFGNYLEVVCYFDDKYEDSVEYAFKCEGEASDTWDDAARAELGLDNAPYLMEGYPDENGH